MVEIIDIEKKLGAFHLHHLNFSVNAGDYVIILGPSGSGKTILLELIAGLISPDNGKILFKGKDITKLELKKRPFGLVYQDQNLFPHRTVEQNLEFPLKFMNIHADERKTRIRKIAERIGIENVLDQYPESLSGGEKQRVAIARTLLGKPACLLLDEPLSSLDNPMRKGIENVLQSLNEEGQPILHVTHNLETAHRLGNKIGVMGDGELLQFGKIAEVIANPVSTFVSKYTKL